MKRLSKIGMVILSICILMLGGCARQEPEPTPGQTENQATPVEKEPVLQEMDWTSQFEGLEGAAVLYIPEEERYLVYNLPIAQRRRSPCSTFKIIAAATALENGSLVPEDSTRKWSGEKFWNQAWNRDIDFAQAFQTSCVWYFRQMIDELGAQQIQAELNKLQYGNQDISDWEGRLNTNNDNRALTGFWIESSLKISPIEQAEVMERIFGEHSLYSQDTQDALRQVMLAQTQEKTDMRIYGKTGMGKSDGVVVDSWYTGFAEMQEGHVYFCVYLGETEEGDVSSQRAKEIAFDILSAYQEGAES